MDNFYFLLYSFVHFSSITVNMYSYYNQKKINKF